MNFNKEQSELASVKAEALKAVLEARILGRRLSGFESDFAVLQGESVAVAVLIPSQYNAYQKVLSYLWTVKMEQVSTTNYYTIGLNSFIPDEEIRQLFLEHFGSLIDIAKMRN